LAAEAGGPSVESNILEKLNVNVVGSGEPTVVFAHGFGSDQTVWRHQVAAIEKRHRVVLLDYLGCGASDVSGYSPLEYRSLDRYAEDVAQIHEALGIQGTVFVGHSVSGMIGLLLSRARPELISKIVLVGSSPRYLNDVDYKGGFERRDIDVLYAAMATDYLSWANGFARLAMANGHLPELGEEFAQKLSSMRPDIAQSVARLIFEVDLRDILPEIRIPVLVLQSSHDVAVPKEVGRYLAARLPNSRLVELEAEGHLPHLSAPEQVTAALVAFLEDDSR
jgi:sigma-B regulation protein RsbQ